MTNGFSHMKDVIDYCEEMNQIYEVQREADEFLYQLMTTPEEQEAERLAEEQKILDSFNRFRANLFKPISVLEDNEHIHSIVYWSKTIIIDNAVKWRNMTTKTERQRMRLFLELENVENIPNESIVNF